MKCIGVNEAVKGEDGSDSLGKLLKSGGTLCVTYVVVAVGGIIFNKTDISLFNFRELRE